MRATGMKSETPIATLRQSGAGNYVVAAPVIADRTQGIAIAASGQANLPQHARQDGAHPDRLLTVFGPLERMGHHDQDPAPRQAACQPRDSLSGDTGDRFGPGSVLGLAIGLAQDVALEDRPALAVAVKKGAVVQPLRHQCVSKGQHQRRVGSRDDAKPFRRRLCWQIIAKRADQPRTRSHVRAPSA